MRKVGLLLLMPLVALLGCSDNDEKLENVLNYDGDVYVLNAKGSYISDFGVQTIAEADFYNYRFTLSNATDYNENGPVEASISLVLNLYALSGDEFKTGNYNFSDEEEPDANFMHADSELVVGDDVILINGGSVTVNKSGNRWMINYELELENDKSVEGEFSGIIDVVDETE
jgi:hypothetical protein